MLLEARCCCLLASECLKQYLSLEKLLCVLCQKHSALGRVSTSLVPIGGSAYWFCAVIDQRCCCLKGVSARCAGKHQIWMSCDEEFSKSLDCG
jgi:hypothetical protein